MLALGIGGKPGVHAAGPQRAQPPRNGDPGKRSGGGEDIDRAEISHGRNGQAVHRLKSDLQIDGVIQRVADVAEQIRRHEGSIPLPSRSPILAAL